MIDSLRKDPLDEVRHLRLLNQGDCEFSENRLTNHPHTHAYEVCFVIDGSGAQVHNGEVIKLSKNDVFLAESEVIHEVNAFDSGYLRVFYVVFELPSHPVEPGIVSQFMEGHVLVARNQERLRSFVDQILVFEELGFDQRSWLESTSALFLLAALESLTTALPQSDLAEHPILEKAVRYLRQRAADVPDLASIARAAGTSPRNLQLLFKRHLGRTVIETLNQERCRHASRYLDMGFLCSDVGPIIGIDDPCQFSRFFKRYTGKSPTEYRNKGEVRNDE